LPDGPLDAPPGAQPGAPPDALTDVLPDVLPDALPDVLWDALWDALLVADRMTLFEKLNNISITSSPAQLAGLFFSVLCLLPYSFALEFNETAEYIWISSYYLCGLYLIFNLLPWKLHLITVPFLFLTGISEYRLFILPLFFLWLTRNNSSEFKHQELFSVCLFTLPAFFLLINLLGYHFGFPVTLFIWFFGLPLFLLSILIALAKKKAVIVLIASNAILISYCFLTENHAPTYYKIKAEQSNSVLDRNSFLGVAENTKSISPNEFYRLSDENPIVTAILPEAPNLLQNLKFPTSKGALYLFGEHDDLKGFIKGDIGKEFKPNRYQRKRPWHIYNPVKNYAFLPNFNRSIIYCSNIGCTLNDKIYGLPLVWDYTYWGVPKILAKLICQDNFKLYLFGDSDPVVGFLAPYNRPFIYDIYDMTPRKWLPLFVSLLIIATCFFVKSRYICFLSAVLVVLISALLQPNIETSADINIVTDGQWLSPHYDHHFSSLPKKLAENGYTISISKRCKKSSYNILIIKDYINLNKSACASTKNLVLGMPKAKIRLINGETIIPQSVPLGDSRVKLNGCSTFISDIRNLSFDSGAFVEGIFCLGRTCVVGTGNPANVKDICVPNG